MTKTAEKNFSALFFSLDIFFTHKLDEGSARCVLLVDVAVKINRKVGPE